MCRLTLLRFLVAACVGLVAAPSAPADPKVSLTASAEPAYTERKYREGKPRPETYVFMQGSYFAGDTVDRSIERMPFRRIAEYLAPELAKQQYLPAPALADADLLVVVHWGTTRSYVSTQEMMGRTSPVTDTSNSTDTMIRNNLMQSADSALGGLAALGDNRQTQLNFDRLEQVSDRASADMHRADNTTLLGYADDLYRLRRNAWATEEERSLRYDLSHERYFIILKAYDLKAPAGGSRHPVWTMNLNISSPGNNFRTALERMSVAAVSYVGRTTGDVRTVRPGVREGRVNMPPIVILKETK